LSATVITSALVDIPMVLWMRAVTNAYLEPGDELTASRRMSVGRA
jgi:hypothetical protein